MDHLRIYNTLDSTNKEAQRLLAGGPVENGTSLLAGEQTDGRGQLGRKWFADRGSHLAMSIILVLITFQPQLPLIGSKPAWE
jgi:BirA family biotin operon repressor/biotin-[acetyl-CoA-carboxylase] ligase